jgi:hypothetical protein
LRAPFSKAFPFADDGAVLADAASRGHFPINCMLPERGAAMAVLRRIRIALILLTGLAVGVSWGALEQSPQTKEWLADRG